MNAMKKTIWTLLALSLCAIPLLAAGCGTAAQTANETVHVDQSVGAADVPLHPRRIVALDFGALETVEALGEADAVVGVPQELLPDSLSVFRDEKYTNIGNAKEYSLEAISKLAPDLILIGGRQEPNYQELSKIAPVLDMAVDSDDFYDSFAKNTETLGKLFGKEDLAREKLAAIRAKLTALKEKAAAKPEKGLFLMVTGGKLHAFGPGSHYGLLYGQGGLSLGSVMEKATAKEEMTHGQTISFEYVASKNPDYLLVLDRDGAIGQKGAGTARDLMATPLIEGTTAAKTGRIVYLDPVNWYLSGNGLLSVEAMLDELAPLF